MRLLIDWLIAWPERIAKHLMWLAPLFARITVGWVFLFSGWGKLQQFAASHREFYRLGNPFPAFLYAVDLRHRILWWIVPTARIVDAHIEPGALGVTMIVAIKAAEWGDVDSLETLLGFDEFEYLALFLWLAIAGAGAVSLDYFLEKMARRPAPA